MLLWFQAIVRVARMWNRHPIDGGLQVSCDTDCALHSVRCFCDVCLEFIVGRQVLWIYRFSLRFELSMFWAIFKIYVHWQSSGFRAIAKKLEESRNGAIKTLCTPLGCNFFTKRVYARVSWFKRDVTTAPQRAHGGRDPLLKSKKVGR